MSNVEVRYNEEHDQHELGAEVDGAWVPFATVTGGQVKGYQRAAENAKENEQAEKG